MSDDAIVAIVFGIVVCLWMISWMVDDWIASRTKIRLAEIDAEKTKGQ